VLANTYELVALDGRAKLAMLRALALPLRVLTWALPSQGNCFGFWVTRPRYPADLQPWLELDHGDIVPKRHR
jgi:hypothetical protein